MKIVAESLKQSAAQYNAFAARYGGDEFCFVLAAKGTDTDRVIENLRKNLEQAQIQAAPNREYILSISIGSYFCTHSDSDIRLELEKADKVLYADKKR